MNILRTSRNLSIIAFLLSLLFHGSTILYIFSQKTYKNIVSSTEQDQHNRKEIEKQQKQTPWVETKARADNFGTPVFFKDEPEESKQPEQKQAELEQNKTDKIKDFSSTEEVNREAKKDILEIPQQFLDIPDIPSEPSCESSQKNNVVINTTASASSKTIQKKTTIQKKFQATKTEVVMPKPPITFAELAQGFLHQKREQSGAYGISMLGMKNGLPTDEQMKYERYLQKLCWCIQNSLKINEHKQPRLLQPTNIYIFFALNRDGTLKQLSIKKSSGNIQVDQFALFIFRDASSSFPPVPSYLLDDPFSMTCILS